MASREASRRLKQRWFRFVILVYRSLQMRTRGHHGSARNGARPLLCDAVARALRALLEARARAPRARDLPRRTRRRLPALCLALALGLLRQLTLAAAKQALLHALAPTARALVRKRVQLTHLPPPLARGARGRTNTARRTGRATSTTIWRHTCMSDATTTRLHTTRHDSRAAHARACVRVCVFACVLDHVFVCACACVSGACRHRNSAMSYAPPRAREP